MPAVKRTGKVHKIVKRSLYPRQCSAFEGFITEGKLNALKKEIELTVDAQKDSVVIYTMESSRYIQREEIGKAQDNKPFFYDITGEMIGKPRCRAEMHLGL